ncbi:hypothetical protein JS533_010650 [Bifidobacterium amazonense]|uniref:ABC transporter permease n=1 Tax=Bifidobacterium amazonense TaxID=2809027 RepID=A0ABS9VY27_9BIFI|nr:hypothetical protein [Bifidobacterium amazonense]MCH9276725.1 hypothetical protein [Bifidobacterium amazonense]
MKPTAILSEAWRNIATGTTRALACAAILTLIATGTAVLDLTGILSLQHESRQWATSAADIHIISGSKQIDSNTCASLTRTTGTTTDGNRTNPIQAAGALKNSGEITLTAMPAAPLDEWQATPGLADVLGIGATQQTHPGVWISSQLADTLHAHEGDDLPTDQGVMHISAVFPWTDDSRDQRLVYAIITPTPINAGQQWDECWAVINPANPDAEDLLNTTATAIPGAAPATQTKQANTMLGTNPDLHNRYRQRSTRIMLAITPIAAFAIALAATRARRIEIADDLHMGLPRRGILATNALETLAWTLPAILAATTITYATGRWTSGHANALTLTTIQLPALAAALITAQIGAATAITAIHDNQLFAFFKNRQ